MSGILYSLRTLAAKADFEPIEPTHPDVAYASTEGRRGTPPLVDIYLPDAEDRPSVLLVHGGGFVLGSRRMKAIRLLAKRISQSGFAVAAVEYRMIGRGGRLREAVADVVAAARWWTEVGPSEFGVRPGPTSILGLSAGATLCMLAADEVGEGVIDDLVSVFGLYDFAGIPGPLGYGLRRFVVGSTDPREWAARSPVHCSLKIPVTLLHGTSDRTVPVEQAQRLHRLRTEAGLPTTVHLYEGARHAFFNFERVPPSEEAMGDVLSALRRAAECRG